MLSGHKCICLILSTQSEAIVSCSHFCNLVQRAVSLNKMCRETQQKTVKRLEGFLGALILHLASLVF